MMLEKGGIISQSVLSCSSPVITAPKKGQAGELPQKHFYVDYCALNRLLPIIVKAHFKALGVLSLVLLPR